MSVCCIGLTLSQEGNMTIEHDVSEEPQLRIMPSSILTPTQATLSDLPDKNAPFCGMCVVPVELLVSCRRD